MKRLFIVIFVIAILHLLTTSVFAGPTALPPIVFRDFSYFNELRDMGENATDEELRLFLQSRGYYEAGIRNRGEVRAFVDIVGRALIPVLPNTEDASGEIIIQNGSGDFLRHHGSLAIRYHLPNGIAIGFTSYFGSHNDSHARVSSAALNAIDALGSPTFERRGVRYYQSLNGYSGFFDFVIVVDDNVLTARFATNEDFSIEARRAEIQRFSFVRLEDNERLSEPAWPLYLAIIAFSAFFIAISAKIIRNLKLGGGHSAAFRNNNTEN